MRFVVILSLALPVAAQEAASTGPVTFNHDVAPIIYQNCAACHRPDTAAPFSLLSYDDVVKKARTIAKVTANRVMPPWKAEPASYPYRDTRRLTDDQIAILQAWVKQGMPEGKSSDKPSPPQFTSGWQLGPPDMIVEMPEAFHIPADGPDIYRNISVPLTLTNDEWVTAIEIRPTARQAVHHVLYFADPNGKVHLRPRQGSEPGFGGLAPGRDFYPLGGWAVGGQTAVYPDGLALALPMGSDLMVQYHFHPTGKPEVEKSVIGFYFAKKPPERSLVRVQMPPDYSLFSDLEIPAGDKDFVIRDTYTLPVAVDAVGVSAHAHYLATQMKMTATLPDGDVKTLLYIKDWDFAWQDKYFFQDLEPLPVGTRLDVEIHWDNSADNPRNPTLPPVRVTWGEETKDEMGSISLIAVAQKEDEATALRRALRMRTLRLAAEKMRQDPELRRKVNALLAE